jgi:hypothetical protein
LLVKIVSVNIERIKKGKADYSKATVIYTFNGQARTQNIMSFANPAVFAKIQEWEVALPEGEVNVEVGKNDAGYNEWRSIGNADSAQTSSSPPGAQQGAAPRAATNTFSGGRDFETREERAARQVLIVKQSSLAQAVEFLKTSEGTGIGDVLDTAQQFADWVFDNGGNDNV